MEKEKDQEIPHNHFCNHYEDSGSFLPVKYRNGTCLPYLSHVQKRGIQNHIFGKEFECMILLYKMYKTEQIWNHTQRREATWNIKFLLN